MKKKFFGILVIMGLMFFTGCEDDSLIIDEGIPVENSTPIDFELTWQKSIGEFYKSESVFSFIKTKDGGYMSSGSIRHINENTDVCVVKYNSNLEVVWEKIFSGNNHERGSSLLETYDGNYIVAGNTNSTEGDIKILYGSYDVFLLKFDNSGNIIWQKSYGGSKTDGCSKNSLIEIDNGNLMLIASSASNDFDVKENHGGRDLWLLNIKSDGEIEWDKSYGGSMDEYSRQIFEYKGNYIVGLKNNSNDGDFFQSGNIVSMFDSDGEVQWISNLGGLNYGKTIIDKSGGFISLLANDEFMSNLEVVKMNESGEILWKSNFGGSRQEFGQDILQIHDFSLIVLGLSSSNDGDIESNYGSNDIIVSKLSSKGKILGIKNFGGSKREWANCILETGKGEYLINASTISYDFDIERNGGDTELDNWLFKIKEIPE